MSTEINWGVIAVLLVVLAGLRGRLLLALLVVLAPVVFAQLAGTPDASVASLGEVFAIPGRIGPVGLFLLVLLGLLPTSARGFARPRKAS
jgi:hypothetical protein